MAAQHHVVIVAQRRDIHAGRRVGQADGRNSRVFQSMPRNLEHHPLTSIDVRCLAWGNSEERGVEPIEIIQKTAPPSSNLSGNSGIRMEKAPRIPALARHLADSAALFAQQIPECLKTIRSREAATHPDNS